MKKNSPVEKTFNWLLYNNIDGPVKRYSYQPAHLIVEKGRALGVQGTPGFFVNGRFLRGAQPYEEFEKIIDDELRRKGLS